MAFQLLALIVPELELTPGKIAYNVKNTMDETLIVTVCSEYFGNIIISRRKVFEVTLSTIVAHVCLMAMGNKLDRN